MSSHQLLLETESPTPAALERVHSPFRYPGGKYYALKFLLPFIEARPHDEYREPFVGGGSVFFAKTLAKTNWLNDLDDDLVCTYLAIQNQRTAQKLAASFDNEVATRKRHAEVKALQPTNDYERAWRTFYLNRTSYSGIINKPAWGYRRSQSMPPENWGGRILAASERLRHCAITNHDFTRVVEAPASGSRVLMYLDPPYYHADQKRAYVCSFKVPDHLRLAESLRETEHDFCLSYDDAKEVRDLYSWAHVYERQWLYNTSNLKGEARPVGRELVITSYKLGQARTLGFDEL